MEAGERGLSWGEELPGGDLDWHYEARLALSFGTQGKRSKQWKHFGARCKPTRIRIALKYTSCQVLS